MRPALLFSMIALVTTAMAQGRAVVPALAATLPGNAALSMPLRWSQGVAQVCIASVLLPANFIGQQIRGVRLRRPTLLAEPAFPAVQRTLTVRACFTTTDPVQLQSSRTANQPANLQVVAGPGIYTVAATAPASGAQPLGAEFLVLPFAQPLPVTAGNLFLEFEAGDVPMAVGDVWTDAVWIRGGIDRGYPVAIGDGTCTLAAQRLHLVWSATAGPVRGTNAVLTLSGAAPDAMTFAWVGIEPQTRAPGGAYVGFGASLGLLDPNLAACQQWAPLDATFFGTANGSGVYTLTFPIAPALTTTSMRLGVQAGYVDFGRPGLPVSVSNGEMLVLDSASIDNRCSTVLFPGAATVSPWGVQFGLMPVIVLDL